MNKNYNYERSKLILPEYGRHIQNMVDALSSIEDRHERNKQAVAIIAVMGNINPILRDSADFTHKLWDHMFIMSGFNLDVDSPYPIPTATTLHIEPQRLRYPLKNIKTKYYGKNIENIIRALIDAPGSESVEETIGNLARFMRTKSYEFNQEHPNNEIIIKDIKEMSDNRISINEDAINNIKSDYKSGLTAHQRNAHKSGKINKNSKNGKIYRKRNS